MSNTKKITIDGKLVEMEPRDFRYFFNYETDFNITPTEKKNDK